MIMRSSEFPQQEAGSLIYMEQDSSTVMSTLTFILDAKVFDQQCFDHILANTNLIGARKLAAHANMNNVGIHSKSRVHSRMLGLEANP